MTDNAVRSIPMTPSAAPIQRYRFVEMDNAGTVKQAAAAASDAIGVAREDSAQDSDVVIPVTTLDGSIQDVEAGAAIDISSAVVPVSSDAEGRAITAASSTPILGYALSSASAAGEMIKFVSAKAARQQA